MRAIAVMFTKPVPYADAARLQETLVAARAADRLPDTFLLLEHTPVITRGIRAKQEHLLLSAAELSRRGIDLADSPRGGDITYHAPGQLILYPILKLAGAEADVHRFVHDLEDVAICSAAAFFSSRLRNFPNNQPAAALPAVTRSVKSRSSPRIRSE